MRNLPSDYFEKLGFVDYRKPEMKMPAFLLHYEWRRKTGDLDHSLFCETITEDCDYEQKVWFSLLFGMTYRTAQAYAYLKTFPDFHKTSEKEFEDWNAANWKRTSYGIDTRYNKGHFAEQAISIKKWLGGRTFREKIEECLIPGNPHRNFETLSSEIIKIYKFGRMTTWLAMQCLYDTLKLPINPRTVLIEDPGNKSCYNGAIFMLGREDLIAGKHNKVHPDYSPTKADRELAKRSSEDLWVALEKAFPHWTIDAYKFETILCQHKKMCVTSNEYFGLSVGEASETYEWLAESFPEVDRKQYCKALIVPVHPCLRARRNLKSEYSSLFMKYGCFINQHYTDKEAPNMYHHLEIPETPTVGILVDEAKSYGYLEDSFKKVEETGIDSFLI